MRVPSVRYDGKPMRKENLPVRIYRHFILTNEVYKRRVIKRRKEMIYYKTCVLCDTKIKSSHRLCNQHFMEYRDQMDEPWFIAIAAEQAKQDMIDRRESYCLPYHSSTNLYGVHEAPQLLAKRDVGRPSTDWRIVDKVLCIYDASVADVVEGKATRPKSLRAIAKELGNVVGYVTVRNILKEYRQKEIKPRTIEVE